jgi:hypothetical protein
MLIVLLQLNILLLQFDSIALNIHKDLLRIQCDAFCT